MKRSFLAGILVLLAALAVGAADRVAMFTEVVGKVQVGEQAARTLMPLSSGMEVELPAGARATLTFFSDGHRERLRGPCRVQVASSGSRLVQGAAGALVKTSGAPGTVLAPTGQNLRRMGGSLQALNVPDSPERQEVASLAILFSLDEATGGGGGGRGGGPGGVLKESDGYGGPDEPGEGAVEEPGSGGEHPKSYEGPPTFGAPPPPAPQPAPRLEPGAPPAQSEVAVAPAPCVPPPEPRALTEQRQFALEPTLSWAPGEPVTVELAQEGRTAWVRRCGEGNSVALPGALLPGAYQWRLLDDQGRLLAQAEITVLPTVERVRVRQAFQEARRMGDPSAWVMLMSELADRGLYAEAWRADREALRLQPRDATLHLAAAFLLKKLALEDEARQHALEGTRLEREETPEP